jgi:fluoroquinolone transport system ATP-binding protein
MITVNKLFFGYTKDMFIKDISFEVKKGEIFGFLGPSGAGKSTLQKILIGMLKNYSGSVTVNGTEVSSHDNSFYENIGIDFEFPTLYEKLTARQNLEFFSSLYSKEKRNPDELLEAVGLFADKDKKVSEFSKGMKSRLNFIKSLVHDPDILFLDEPTSGLDPTNSYIMKELIVKEKEKGKTIILTTHNMQDASELCDRVAFIVEGKLKALDTPHNLIMQKSAAKIVYTYKENNIEKSGECAIDGTQNDSLLNRLISQNKLLTIHSKEQTLGDVFMDITGRRLT